MLPQSQPRKKQNSSKVNLTISFVFHAVLVGALLYFAAREGLLGKKIQKISVQMVKEKPPEKQKEPEKPKVEPPKVETPKIEQPKVAEETKPVAPPVTAPPVVAPPNTEVPSFEFEGGKAVNSESDPVQLYKGYIEYVLRSKSTAAAASVPRASILYSLKPGTKLNRNSTAVAPASASTCHRR